MGNPEHDPYKRNFDIQPDSHMLQALKPWPQSEEPTQQSEMYRILTNIGGVVDKFKTIKEKYLAILKTIKGDIIIPSCPTDNLNEKDKICPGQLNDLDASIKKLTKLCNDFEAIASVFDSLF